MWICVDDGGIGVDDEKAMAFADDGAKERQCLCDVVGWRGG